MSQYAQTAKTRCSRGVASCDGTGYRTDKDIPHWLRSGRFSQQTGRLMHGWRPHRLCLVPYAQPCVMLSST